MTLLEYSQQARQDFLHHGPEGHYPCPAASPNGQAPDGRLCVAFRASDLSIKLDADFPLLEDAWYSLIGEQMTHTNERGYQACVEAYDQLILTLTTQPSRTLVAL